MKNEKKGNWLSKHQPALNPCIENAHENHPQLICSVKITITNAWRLSTMKDTFIKIMLYMIFSAGIGFSVFAGKHLTRYLIG